MNEMGCAIPRHECGVKLDIAGVRLLKKLETLLLHCCAVSCNASNNRLQSMSGLFELPLKHLSTICVD
jgi:hypothetical protein